MSNWYYADRDRQRHGPMDGATLAQRFNQGLIGLDVLVWREGMVQWQPLADMTGELGLLADTPAVPPVPAAADDAQPEPDTTEAVPAGRAVFTAREPSYQMQGQADTFSTVTAGTAHHSPYSAPSAPLLGHGHVVVLGGEVVYAGFWKRVAASVIDSFIMGMAGAIIGGIIGGVMGAILGFGGGPQSGGMIAIQVVSQVVSLTLNACYYAYFHASTHQATLGKRAVGIKVVRSSGEPISFMRGFGRYFALALSSLTLGIGLIMAGFTERKRALHDMMCDTLVVDRWAFTDQPERQRPELGGVTIGVLIGAGVLAVLGVVLAGVLIAAIGSGGFGQ